MWKQEPCLVTCSSPASTLTHGIYFLKDCTDRERETWVDEWVLGWMNGWWTDRRIKEALEDGNR